MVSFRLFLILLVTLISRECAGHAPEGSLGDSLLAVLGVALGFGLLGKFSALQLVNTRSNTQLETLEKFSARRKLIESLWVMLLPWMLILTGWAQWSNCLADLGTPQTLVLLSLFLPSLLMIALIEMSAAQLDELIGEPREFSDQIEHLDLRQNGQTQASWLELWRIRMRLGEFASFAMCLTPVALISLSNDVLQGATSALGLPISANQSSWIAAVMAIGLILFMYPLMLGRFSGAIPLRDSALKERIERLRTRSHIGGLSSVEIPSRGRWNGAAVVGWFPTFRQLWLGDGLLEQLSDEELDMVVLHEIAHVKRFHFVWRSLPMVWAAMVGGGLYWLCAEIGFSGSGSMWAAQCVSLAAAGGVLLFGLGTVSRSCELDADRTACELAEALCPWAFNQPGTSAATLCNALAKIIGSSPAAAQSTWLHPSLHQRLQSLADYLANRKRELHSATHECRSNRTD